MVVPRRSGKIVAQSVEIGPLFATDTAPGIQFILTYDAGGYVDLTGATIRAGVRRYDQVRRQNIGGVVTSGACTIQVATEGDCVFEWTEALPVATVPVDPGYYAIRGEVTFAGGKIQQSQDCIFEVLPKADVGP